MVPLVLALVAAVDPVTTVAPETSPVVRAALLAYDRAAWRLRMPEGIPDRSPGPMTTERHEKRVRLSLPELSRGDLHVPLDGRLQKLQLVAGTDPVAASLAHAAIDGRSLVSLAALGAELASSPAVGQVGRFGALRPLTGLFTVAPEFWAGLGVTALTAPLVEGAGNLVLDRVNLRLRETLADGDPHVRAVLDDYESRTLQLHVGGFDDLGFWRGGHRLGTGFLLDGLPEALADVPEAVPFARTAVALARREFVRRIVLDVAMTIGLVAGFLLAFLVPVLPGLFASSTAILGMLGMGAIGGSAAPSQHDALKQALDDVQRTYDRGVRVQFGLPLP